MAMKPTAPPPNPDRPPCPAHQQCIGIHQIPDPASSQYEDEEAHGHGQATTRSALLFHDHEVQNPRNPILATDNHCQQRNKQPHRSFFSRQVSLETGFSALDRESKASNTKRNIKNGEGRRLLSSGNSFSGFPSDSNNARKGNTLYIAEPKRLGRGGGDFSIFRTKSTLNKQSSMLPVRKDQGSAIDPQRPDHDYFNGNWEEPNSQSVAIPNVRRYFAALRGPELDEVRESEDILLPKDEKWPFLLRFPINCFGICLGLGSQSILWGALANSQATQFLHITPFINLVLWLLALASLMAVSATYALKCAFYFEAVRREYHHPVRVNFFFAPFIVCMFLAIGAPPRVVAHTISPAVWCAFMAPVFILELKIYGQWLSGGKRRISKVVNPSTHLSVVGNFVGAILACKVEWREAAKFFWAVGLAHYLVVFVTLYQRLPSSDALPKELHPVYSMFIAAPSAASIAWGGIYGEFDGVSRTCYFIALFLYVSLVVRINFFWGFRFSLAWWSYTFPMTTASLATIKYAEQVPTIMSKGLVVILSLMSSTMVSLLLLSTILHAFVWRSLFPNDLAIAIAINKKRAINSTNGSKTFQATKERKKMIIKPLNIRRWAKKTPLSFASS